MTIIGDFPRSDNSNKADRLANERKRIYFSGAIRGDTSHEKFLNKIFSVIKRYGEPLAERCDLYNFIDENLGQQRNAVKNKRVYKRDIIHWIGKSNALVAEISGGSTGVGYEICYAIRDREIPVLCLYHRSDKPSLMVKQNLSKYILKQQYSSVSDLEKYLSCFLEVLMKTEDINDIRLAYGDVSKEIACKDLSIREIKEKIDRLLP